jgi:hypothetical protein
LETVEANRRLGILCDKCGAALSASQRKGRVCWNCRYAERSQRRLDQAYTIVGHACWRCGYSRGVEGRRVLDFHHVDRSNKSFPLDCRHIINLAWEKVSAEMQKCVLLCANCHREVETGLVPADEVIALHDRNWRKITFMG